MNLVGRFGLALGFIVIYAMLTYVLPDDLANWKRMVFHILILTTSQLIIWGRQTKEEL